jgi:hypothetical protein
VRARIGAPALAAVLAFVLSLLLFGAFVPRLYSADDLQYAAVIRTAVSGVPVYHPAGGSAFPASRGDTSLPVNPRYMLDWPTSVGAVRLARLFGWDNELGAILATRVLAGALGVAFFLLAAFRFTGRLWVAGVAAAFLAGSLVYRTYSTHLDESIPMLAFTNAALFVLAGDFATGSRRGHSLVPVLLGIASLYNFTAVVTAVVVSAFWGRVTRFAALYAGTCAVGVLGGLVVTGSAAKIVSRSYWKSSLFVGHPEYGFRPLHDAFDAAGDFVRALVAYPPVRGLMTLRHYFDSAPTGARVAALLFYGVVALAALVPAVVLLRRRAALGRPALFAATWFLASLAFAWWWDPRYIKYFLLPVASWCLLLALALGALPDHRRSSRVAILASLCVCAVLALNLATIFLPQSHDGNPWRTAADELRASSPDALFVSAGQSPLDFYIPYFTNRDVVSAGLIRFAANVRKVAQVVSEHVRQHRRRGGPIYVYGLRTVGPAARRDLLALLPGTRLERAWTFPGVTIFRRT